MANGFILNVFALDLTPLGERKVQLPIRLGRSSLNDVAITHRLVSEFHARIEEVNGKLCVRDLSSKNGVFVEKVGAGNATRVAAQQPTDLEPYGFEFLMSPLLRVRVRPANADELGRMRHSEAEGAVLGNARLLAGASSALAEEGAHARPGGGSNVYSASPAAQPYESAFIEPASVPLELPHVGASSARHVQLPPLAHPGTGFNERAILPATVLEPPGAYPALPNLTHTAWASVVRTEPGVPYDDAYRALAGDAPTRALEALALRGLRELAASLSPGQTIEQPTDVVRIVTKLHDALEIFCRCFIPVREACARFIPADALELSATDRCRRRSNAYLAVERAREPSAVAAALLNCRHDANDAPAAVENILADLMLNHLAFSQGAIEGVRALLDELAPAPDTAQASRASSLLSRLGIGAGNDRPAESHAQRHADIEAAGERFRELFGDEFTRAYREHWSQHARGAKAR